MARELAADGSGMGALPVGAHLDLAYEMGDSERGFSVVEVSRHRGDQIASRRPSLSRQTKLDAFAGKLLRQVGEA